MFPHSTGTEMRCHNITIQEVIDHYFKKKEEQMLANATSSGISWAHIIKLQGGYFGKNRIYDHYQ
jgi:hypothetical protein